MAGLEEIGVISDISKEMLFSTQNSSINISPSKIIIRLLLCLFTIIGW